jgi:hypothetical protein
MQVHRRRDRARDASRVRARAWRRRHVTSVDKANVLETSRLWRSTVQRIAAEYPDVTLEHQLVDSMAMLLLTQPSRYDVIVTENLFGDILTDEAAALAGSLGLLPSASLGRWDGGPVRADPRLRTGHRRPGLANPLGAMLSAALLLRHSLGLEAEAAAIEAAIDHVLEHGNPHTRDIGGNAGTTAVSVTLAVEEHADAAEAFAGARPADERPRFHGRRCPLFFRRRWPAIRHGTSMRSDVMKTGPDRAPARAMMRATGLDDAAIAKPLVAIVHTWSNVSPCNLNLRDLAQAAIEGVRAAGGTPVEFNTIASPTASRWARPACAPRWSAAKSSPIRSSWRWTAIASMRWWCCAVATRPFPPPRWRWRA